MSLFLEAEKSDRQRIRKAMLVEADKILTPLYADVGQRHAAARVMVDRAIAKERLNEHTESGITQ